VQFSGIAEELADAILEGITATTPCGLGYPSDMTGSSYYLGERMARDEIAAVGRRCKSVVLSPRT
jgi:hypothetical protein